MNDSRRILDEVISRLERLPVSWFSYKLLLLLMPAWIVESYDIGIIGATIAVIKPLWMPTATAIATLAVASTVAIAIGLIPSGLLTDRFGRRKMLIGGLIWFSVFTGLGGLAPNIELLTLSRFLAGLGLGAVFPLPYIFLAEFMAATTRAKFVGYLNGLLTAAYLVPPLTAVYLLGHYPHAVAWRLLYFIAFIPLAYAALLLFKLPESPRWLASRGKEQEALHLIEKIEAETIAYTKRPLPAPVRINRDAAVSAHRPSDIFKAPLLRRTMVVWFAFFGTLPVFYALLTFAPTLMVAQGFQLAKSLQFVALLQLAGGIGGLVQGIMGDKVGRRPMIITYAGVASIGVLGLAFGHSVPVLLTAGLLVGFFGLGIFPVVKLYVAEQYPTDIRGFGSGMTESFGRLLGGVAFIYAVPFIARAGGTQLVIITVAILLAGATFIPVLLFGQETRNANIDASQEPLAAGPVAGPV